MGRRGTEGHKRASDVHTLPRYCVDPTGVIHIWDTSAGRVGDLVCERLSDFYYWVGSDLVSTDKVPTCIACVSYVVT
jgi:hypothetical protein